MRRGWIAAVLMVAWMSLGGLFRVAAQIDPYQRDVIHVGYQKELIGHAPIAAYGFYYYNNPAFGASNLALRAAVSPVYLDTELAYRGLAGPRTDLALGAFGGGFASSYDEIRMGRWYHQESWTGHGGGVSASLYHLVNPGRLIPLHAILRTTFHQAFYQRDDTTAPDFVIPSDQPEFAVRAGVRYGGRELDLLPEMGMELSAWYEGQFRLEHGPYGYNGDRRVEASSHLFWGRALLDYTLPQVAHKVGVALNAGTTIHPDRFSAYRIGGLPMLMNEFPFVLPGYYLGELSARNMLQLTGFYQVPLDRAGRWRFGAGASTALLSYTPGLDEPRHWQSGVAAGLSYLSPNNRVKATLTYGYGIDALRDGHQGGHAIAVAMQYDLQRQPAPSEPAAGKDPPGLLRRFMRMF